MINVQFVSYWNRSHNGNHESRTRRCEFHLRRDFKFLYVNLAKRQASQSCENEIPWLATNSQFQLLPSLKMKTHQRRTGAEFKTILIWLKNVIRSTWRKQRSPSVLLFLDLELTVRAWFICQAVSWVENSLGQIILQKSGFGKLGLSDLGSLEDPPMVELFCFLETTSSFWNESQTFQNKMIGNWSVVINPPLNILVWYTAWEY